MTQDDLRQTVCVPQNPVPLLLFRGWAVHPIYLSMHSSMPVCFLLITLPLTTHPRLHPCICPSTHACILHVCMHPVTYVFTRPSIYPYVAFSLPIYTPTHLTSRLSLSCLSVLSIYSYTQWPLTNLFMYPPIHSSTNPHTHSYPSTRPHLCVSIYPGIHSLNALVFSSNVIKPPALADIRDLE